MAARSGRGQVLLCQDLKCISYQDNIAKKCSGLLGISILGLQPACFVVVVFHLTECLELELCTCLPEDIRW